MDAEKFYQMFAPGVIFEYKGNEFKVERSKVLHGTKFIIITRRKTFTMFFSEIIDFAQNVKFLSYFETKECVIEQKSAEKTKAIMEKNIEEKSVSKAIENKNIYLPKVSNTAIDVLENMMQQFKNGAVTKELLEQTKAVCNLTKQMIDVGRLELDYIKQQTDK